MAIGVAEASDFKLTWQLRSILHCLLQRECMDGRKEHLRKVELSRMLCDDVAPGATVWLLVCAVGLPKPLGLRLSPPSQTWMARKPSRLPASEKPRR